MRKTWQLLFMASKEILAVLEGEQEITP